MNKALLGLAAAASIGLASLAAPSNANAGCYGCAVGAGVITSKADPSRRVTYGQLIGGRRFNVTLTGKDIDATTGLARVKPVQELKMPLRRFGVGAFDRLA